MPHNPPPIKRGYALWRLRLRRLAILALVVAGVVFVINLIADNPYTQRVARNIINNKFKEVSPLRLDFRALKLQAFPPALEIYGFRLTTPDDQATSIISTSHLAVQINILSLFLGTPRLHLLSVTDLDVSYPLPIAFDEFLYPDSSSPTPQPTSEESSYWPLPLNLPIDHIAIKNSRLSLSLDSEEQAGFLQARLAGIDLDLWMGGWSDAELHMDISSIFFSSNELNILEGSRLQSQIVLSPQTLRSKKLLLSSSQLNIDAQAEAQFDSQGTKSNPAGIDNIDLRIDSNFQGDLSVLGDILDIDGSDGPIKGTSSLRAMLPVEAQKEPELEVKVEVDSEGAQIAGFKLLDSHLSLTIDSQALHFDQIDLRHQNLSLGTAQGKVNFDDQMSYRFVLNPRSLNFPLLMTALGADFDLLDFDIDAQDANLEGQGNPFWMKISGPAEAKGLKIDLPGLNDGYLSSPPDCMVGLNLYIDSNHLKFLDNAIDCTSFETNLLSKLKLDGPVYFDSKKGVDLNLNSDQLYLETLQHFTPLRTTGNSQLRMRIFGPSDRIQVAIAATNKQSTIEGVPLGESDVALVIDDKGLRSEKLSFDFPAKGEARLRRLELDFDDDLNMRVQGRIKDLPKTVTEAIFRNEKLSIPSSFKLDRLDFALEGPLLKPLAYRADIKVEVSDFSYLDEQVVSQLQTEIFNRGKGWQVKGFKAALGPIIADIEATHQYAVQPSIQDTIWNQLGAGPEDTINAKIKIFHSTQLEKRLGSDIIYLPVVGEVLRNTGLSGNLNANFEIFGSLGSLQATYQIRLDSFAWQGSGLAPLSIKGIVTPQNFDALISHGGNSLQGRLTARLDQKDIPYEVFLKAQRADLRAFITTKFSADPRNFAYLNADLTLKGKALDPWSSRGRLNIGDIRMRYIHEAISRSRTMNLALQQPLSFEASAQGWGFLDQKQLVLSGDQAIIRLKSGINSPPERLDLELQAELDLALLSYFLPGIESSRGRAEALVKVGGSVETPDLYGLLKNMPADPQKDIRPVAIGVVDLRPPFDNVTFDLEFKDGTLSVNTLTADKGNGSISGSGKMFFSDDQHYNSRIDININKAALLTPVPVLQSFDSLISGNLILSGSRLPLRISGDLDVERARSISDFDIRSNLSILKRRSYVADLGPNKQFFELDLRINADQSISVANRSLQSTLSSSLAITGSEASPILTGRVEIDQGRFVYRRDFLVNQGLVTFDDPVRIDPKLDISAFTDIGGYRVTVSITGRASDPVVDLTVDPATREDGTPINKVAILTLLSSGRIPETTSETMNQETTVTNEAFNLLVAGELQALSDGFLDFLGRDLVRNVFFEADSTQTGTPIATLNTQMNLGEDIDLVFRFGQDASRVSFEYSLHDNITVLGSFDGRNGTTTPASNQAITPTTDTGVDLRFRFPFQ